MPKLTREEVYTNKHVRLFFQLNGPFPSNPLTYYGTNAQYAMLDGLNESFGAVNPIYARDPLRQEGWVIIGRTREQPELPTATLTLMEKIGYVPRNLGNQCPFNLYLPIGPCGNLADPTNGWDVLTIIGGAVAETRDRGERLTQEGDNALTDAYALKISETYDIGQLAFGEQVGPQVDREVLDLAWGGGVQCGGCGPQDDGSTRLYILTSSSGAGSPGLQAEVIYVQRDPTTGAITTFEYPLTYLSTSEQPSFLDVMGNYVVVGSNDAGSIAYAEINPITGRLGSFTEVTTGIVAGKEPNDIYVANPFEAWVVGDGGYIYKLTDPTAGVSVLNAGSTTTNNLNRIHGEGQTIVAVGASATVVISSNRGESWALSSASPGAAALKAVQVKDRYHYWVGGSSRYYTLDGGASWTEKAITGASTITDLLFVTPEVGYTLYNTGSAARLQATFDGGSRWLDSSVSNSRIRGWPSSSFQQVNRCAAPQTTLDKATGFLAAGGRVGASGTDGVLQIGITATL
jgi:hypothetical protein